MDTQLSGQVAQRKPNLAGHQTEEKATIINNNDTTTSLSTTPDDSSNQHHYRDFKYRVGYWWSEKKSQKLSAIDLANLFAERDCQFVKIDLERPIEEQGPFSLIVHKISDILVKADHGDNVAKKTIGAFESYVRKHPETVMMDPLDNNRALLDRYKQYRLIEQSGLAKEGVVFTPPFVHLTSTNIDVNRGRIRRSKITFPLVCKPILAQGSTGAHQMCIIFNEAGLKDVKPPCVAQSFVNHNAKLFKLFVIKDKYYIMERPSLKNFQAGDKETVFFYSHDISKPNSSSSLTELDELDKLRLEQLMSRVRLEEKEMDRDGSIIDAADIDDDNNKNSKSNFLNNNNIEQQLPSENNNAKQQTSGNTHNNSPLMPSNERLDKIVRIFSEKLGLTFYGIDIIIENETSRYAIIDMNTFPGYDGVENFLTIFRDVVCDAIPKDSSDNQNQVFRMKINRRKPTEIDSGIEST